MKRLCIISIFPVDYQISIYNALSDYFNVHVIYLLNYGIDRDDYDHEYKTEFSRANKTRNWKFTHEYIRDSSNFKNKGGFFEIKSWRWIFKRQNWDFDAYLIQSYSTFSEIFAMIVLKVMRKKIIFKGETTNILNNNFKSMLKYFTIGLVLRRCDLVGYSCLKNKESFLSFGVSNSRLFYAPVVANSKDYLGYDCLSEDFQTKLDDFLACNKNKKIILTACRLTERKRVDLIIESVKKNENFALIIAGDGPEMQALRSFCAEIENRVLFMGLISQRSMGGLIRISDLGMLMSTYDPTPKFVNEMLEHGKPMIASSTVGTAGDLVKDKISGLIVHEPFLDNLNEALVTFSELQDERPWEPLILNHMKEWSVEVWAKNFVSAID